MKPTNRRTFMLHVVAAGSACAAATAAHAQTPAPAPKLDEADPQAVALGYKHDTTKVDAKKYPNHTAAQTCATCQLYQAKATDPWGPCPLFAGKQVAAKGWCASWVKKAA